MDERMEEIMILLDSIATEIIVPLRSKIINEPAFNKLYEIMDELQDLLRNEKKVEKDLVAILFLIYTQLGTQSRYVPEEDKKRFTPYISKMREKMRNIFGKALQNEGA
ncbi:hypothetical protein [Paenibacillus durus]|uniref:Uncharacterized protein n=1 Tax=Paenibacillus durus ATCC 35681 TaxID=1333534 RepID=A0A0F7FCF9_PAEDU|nr:hypothetical protein [Paenibacillus durus]AKG36408.1 hypothetical protein VK70_19190 [Paenibacillus durus ATCC 35681]